MKFVRLTRLWGLNVRVREWLERERRRGRPRLGLEQLEDRSVPALVTNLVKVINPTGDSSPGPMVNVNGTLFFSADDGVHGRELWKSDGTAAGTTLVADINPGANASNPSNLTAVGNTLFFSADDGSHGTELWKSDGTAAGTQLVADIDPGSDTAGTPFSSFASNLTAVGGTLFFSADDGVHGRELWKSDGTAAGTQLVADIFPEALDIAPNSSFPSSLTPVGDTLFFSADDGTTGTELWKTDGTTAGTQKVKDIFPGTDSFGTPNSSFPFDLTDVNGALFFSANDGADGVELWKSDGTPGGTVLVADINPGPSSSAPFLLTASGGELFFGATDANNDTELWKSDGTAAGTVEVKNINQTGSSLTSGSDTLFASEMAAMQVPGRFSPAGPLPRDLVFLNPDDGTHGSEPWVSDGTDAGTLLLRDINPGAAPSAPHNLTPVAGTLFFAANDGTNGIQLWDVRNDPLVTSVSSTSANGTYGAGASINVTITFDTPMTLTGGNLIVTLNNGVTVTIMPFANSFTASGTYTVAPGDMANPLDTTALTLAAGATLTDADGNAATLTIPAGGSLKDLKNIVVNGHVPVVTKVNSTTPDGTYGSGASINVTVTFDTPLTLTGGNLRIALNTRAVVIVPPFSNATTASGTYLVGPNDAANPLDTNSLALDPGATLRDALGNTASLAIPAGQSLRDNDNIIIFTPPPHSPPPVTIHSKIGVARPAADGTMSFLLDSNGDGRADAGDAAFTYGYATDTILIGDWTGQGFDSIAVVRPTASGVPSITFDTNGDGVFDAGDQVAHFGRNGDTFLVGDWNGDGRAKIGVERPGPNGTLVVTLDENGDGVFDTGDSVLTFGLNNDVVFVGDWDGSGNANQLGSVRLGADGVAVWTLQTASGYVVDHFGYNTDTFVVGDWTGDGKTKIGVIRANPDGSAVWSLDTNGDGVFDAGDQVLTFGRGSDFFLVGAWSSGPALTAADGRLNASVSRLAPDAALSADVRRAVAEWAAAGLDAASVARLQSLAVRVADLPGATLSESNGNTIMLDATAAGHGWSEGPSPEPGKMDLTTALAHEMGHALGLAHSPLDGDVMFETLAASQAKEPTAADVAALGGR
jgi:ELWxxDGT repeat protein